MTFLAPIPALIAAAITVPGLLVLYFLKLRRRPVRVSSTLLWDQAIRDLQVNVPFRVVRPTWLLFLQLLILALFLLAFARPALDLPQGSPTKVILLIDRSASMSARDAGPDDSPRSRLDAARARAIERIDALSGAGSTFAVVAFAAEPALLGPPSDAAAAKAAIALIEPSDQPGNLVAALQLASGLMQSEATESSPRVRGMVVLFSDGSFAGSEPLALAGAEFRYERIGPAPPAIPDEAPAAFSHDNLGIVAIAARREWEDPTVVRMFARIQNASRRAVTTPVTLSLDTTEVESVLVTVPAATPDATGSVPVSFKLDTREGGVATLRITRGDALSADNTASLILSPATKPRILVVIPDPTAAPRTDWIITNVIEELRLPMRVMNASLYAQEASSLKFDLVIFDRVSPRVAPPVPSLSFGAGISGITLGPEPGPGGYIISWKRTHAVLRHAALDTVYIARPLPISGAGPEDELVRGPEGPLIVTAPGTGPRRIVAAFDLAQSNWPVQVGFALFLASAIDYLTLRAQESAGLVFSTAEPAQIVGSGTIRIDGPRQVSITGPPRVGEPVNIGVLDRAGVYRVLGAPEGGTPAFAVNLLDETESAVGVRESLRVSGQVVAAARGDGGPREIWAWLIGAALVLLSIEWVINAWMMRV